MPFYPVDPTNPLSPLDSQGAKQGAEEFRALKAYIQGLAGFPGASGVLSGFRNRIINGCFRFDQIKEGASAYSVVASTADFCMDQFSGGVIGASGVYSVQRELGGLYSGEYNALLTVTTADAAIAAGDYYLFYTMLEGYNVADLLIGTVDAKPVTLSFDVQSNIVGTFGVAFKNSAGDRCYIGNFTINAVNTKERKTITVPMDTVGVWLKTNGVGLAIHFCLAVGTTYQTIAGVWVAGAFFTSNAQTNFMATNGNTLRIGKIQLEQSNAATPFEIRSYSTELNLIQRYYAKTFNQGVAVAQNAGNVGALVGIGQVLNQAMNVNWRYPVRMRAAPTITTYSTNAGSANWETVAAVTPTASTSIFGATLGDSGVSIFGFGTVNPNAGYNIHASANGRLS